MTNGKHQWFDRLFPVAVALVGAAVSQWLIMRSAQDVMLQRMQVVELRTEQALPRAEFNIYSAARTTEIADVKAAVREMAAAQRETNALLRDILRDQP